jgi:hypothetical protein
MANLNQRSGHPRAMAYAGIVFTSILLVMQVGGSSAFAATPFHADGNTAKVHEEKNASKGQPGESTLKGDTNSKPLKVHGESGAAKIMVKIHADRHEVPFGGGSVKFDYEVTNPGKFALTDFQISDNACRPISARFGDKKSKVGFGDEKAKHVLKPGQVRHFTCTTKVDAETTNKVTVHAKDGSIEVTASDSNHVTVGAGTAVTMTPTPAATPTLVKKSGSTSTRVSKSGSTPAASATPGASVSKSGSTPVASATPGGSVSKSGSTPAASATPTASAGSVSKSGSTPVASATPGASVSKSGSTPAASATPTASAGSVSKSGSTPVASATPGASVSKSGSNPAPVTPTFPNTGLGNDGSSFAWNLALPLGAAAVVFLIVAMRRRQLN